MTSATTSPIKDTIRGSQEMIKKLISSKDRLSGVVSSSSSEKVNYMALIVYQKPLFY